MKKLGLLAIALGSFIGISNAQVEVMYGAKAGVNFSNFTNADSIEDYSDGSEDFEKNMRTGFHAGITGDVKFSDQIGLGAEILYSTQGTKTESKGPLSGETYSNEFKLDYINVPILLKGYIFDGINIYSGIQPGFVVKAENEIITPLTETTIDLKDDESGENKFGLVNDVDLSVPVGLGYRSDNLGFSLDARYNFGVKEVFEDDNIDSKNGVFQLGIGFAF